jgi:hypothetical protein
MFDEMRTNEFVERTEQENGVANPVPEATAAPDTTAENQVPADGHRRFAEAGRKGAARVHYLIRLGRQYEQEHGLKRGRQRLRQLIEEGKRYEAEHGLRPGRPARRKRLSRLGREQLVATLFETLQRMVKPAFREQLRSVVEALKTPKK